MELRDYQINQIEKVKVALAKHKKIGLQLPTGAGKTEIAMEICKKLVKNQKQVVFAISSIDLIDQTYRRFSKIFPESILSVIRANDNRRRKFAYIHILSIDTYIRRESFPELEKVSFFMIDEAHECVAPKYQKLIKDFEGKHFLGLSATFQKVGNKYHSFWDGFVATIDGNFLFEKDYLPFLRIMSPDLKYDLKGVRTSGGDHNLKDVYDKMNEKAVYSDFVENFKKFGEKYPSICFCINIEYANKIHDQLLRIGFQDSIIYHSDLSSMEIINAKNKIKSLTKLGLPFCIVSVDKVSKGFDLPELRTAFMLRPTKSIVKYRQQVGRLTRGVKDVLLIDMTLNTQKFGHPYDFISPQKTGKEKAVGKTALKRCPQCFTLMPIREKVCICGFVFKGSLNRSIVEINANLTEFSPRKKISKGESVNNYFKQTKYIAYKFNKGKLWSYNRLYENKASDIYNYKEILNLLNEQSKSTSNFS